MARRKSASPGQESLLDAGVSTAPCVPAIRAAVKKWRADNYPGVTKTTLLLLNHWFHTDHRLPSGRKFAYYAAQQEAVETLIYLYEVVKVRRQKDLLERFAERGDLRLLQHDNFARYCVKMATGSGKTKVMALAVAWQYFNAVAEAKDDYAQTFLLVAPNVIVFERLRTDFAGGKIFTVDPMIPEELRIHWDFQVYLRGEGERAGSLGALYLTNIQQLYERPERNGVEPVEMAGVMGPLPAAEKQEIEDFIPRIVKRGGPVLVLNDEAHHTHEEESEWNRVIRSLHASTTNGLASQLDFTATPRHSKGILFTWTVYDYPLKQAIIDNIVKRPIKGITTGIAEQRSAHAEVRFPSYLVAGVERWREYRAQLAPSKKKPILFVMLNNTREADGVGAWLRVKYPEEFAGEKLLVIHTDTAGEVSKADLDDAREAARQVDREESPINCIVSVLMLREGWDVRSVTVIVGLRPYSSKANILPEQTIGRGLRLMYPEVAGGYIERVDVIGNPAFIEFVAQLEREEELQLETFEVGKDKLNILTIMADLKKMDKDIALPVLSPVLTRKKSLAEEIAALDVARFDCSPLPRQADDVQAKKFRYEGRDILTLQKLIEREYTIPEPQTPEEVIGYYAQRIAQDVKLPAQFAALVPKVREFLETKAFGERVDLSDPIILKAIGSNVAQYVTVKEFGKALRGKIVAQQEPQLLHKGRPLSETPPFPYARSTVKAETTVFNRVACANEFERRFAEFLKAAPDVARFAKLPEQFGFAIDYMDAAVNMRHYEPDWVVVTADGRHWIAETKGREDIDVKHKDHAARIWCENATKLTGVPWAYVKVPQLEYDRLQPTEFAELQALA